MILLDLLVIALVIVYITDITKFSDSLLRIIWRAINGNKQIPYYLTWEVIHPALKVLECSRCQVWWASLCIVLFNCPSILMVGYCALLSLFAPLFKDIIMFIMDFISRIINGLYDYFNL